MTSRPPKPEHLHMHLIYRNLTTHQILVALVIQTERFLTLQVQTSDSAAVLEPNFTPHLRSQLVFSSASSSAIVRINMSDCPSVGSASTFQGTTRDTRTPFERRWKMRLDQGVGFQMRKYVWVLQARTWEDCRLS